MPTCRRCGRDLKKTELKIRNWSEISKKVFYSCTKCGGNWLYSKNLNCPILIDDGHIISATRGKKGRPKRSKNIRSSKKAIGRRARPSKN